MATNYELLEFLAPRSTDIPDAGVHRGDVFDGAILLDAQAYRLRLERELMNGAHRLATKNGGLLELAYNGDDVWQVSLNTEKWDWNIEAVPDGYGDSIHGLAEALMDAITREERKHA